MFKKILYAIVVIVIIIILAMMWKDSNKQEPIPEVQKTEKVDNSTSEEMTSEIDSINVDSGIDADLNAMDSDLNTL